MTLSLPDGHLSVDQVAAWVDGATSASERRDIERHLATCARCREEVAEVRGVVRTLPAARRSRIWISAAAAAAIVFALVLPASLRDRPAEAHRDQTPAVADVPRVISPVGRVDSLSRVVWSDVPTADRYRVRLFDAQGTVLWGHETSDTTAVVPSTVSLRRGSSYYWKVESRVGFDRWAGSELVEFVP